VNNPGKQQNRYGKQKKIQIKLFAIYSFVLCLLVILLSVFLLGRGSMYIKRTDNRCSQRSAQVG